jgi:hypothetical protein
MTRKYALGLVPSLLLGVGIVAATFVATRAAESGWPVLAAPLLLALAIVGADQLDSRLRGASTRPTTAVGLVAGAFLLAGLIVTGFDPGLVATLIPIIGAAGWVVLQRTDGRDNFCRQPPSAIGS